MSRKFSKDEMKRLIDEEYKKLTELAAKDPVGAVQAIIGFYEAMGYTKEEIDKLMSKQVAPEEEKVIETKLPEGVTMVKFEFLAEVDAKVAEDMFEVMIANGAEFRSAVNMGTMVRAVMYPKGSKTGSPIRMVTKDKDTAWSLQQTIDWDLRDQIQVVAVKKEGLVLEVAYIKKGLKAPPPKEKMIYAFKKTDGWTIKGEEKFK